MDPLNVRAYLARDWGLLARMKDLAWLESREKFGATGQIAVMNEIQQQARLLQPDWPSATDRQCDLAAHQELSRKLALASPHKSA